MKRYTTLIMAAAMLVNTAQPDDANYLRNSAAASGLIAAGGLSFFVHNLVKIHKLRKALSPAKKNEDLIRIASLEKQISSHRKRLWAFGIPTAAFALASIALAAKASTDDYYDVMAKMGTLSDEERLDKPTRAYMNELAAQPTLEEQSSGKKASNAVKKEPAYTKAINTIPKVKTIGGHIPPLLHNRDNYRVLKETLSILGEKEHISKERVKRIALMKDLKKRNEIVTGLAKKATAKDIEKIKKVLDRYQGYRGRNKALLANATLQGAGATTTLILLLIFLL